MNNRSGVFSGYESCTTKSQPTKRAADVWDSARFTSLFSGFEFFLLSSRVHARPHAANADR